jgi:hypothetical protein
VRLHSSDFLSESDRLFGVQASTLRCGFFFLIKYLEGLAPVSRCARTPPCGRCCLVDCWHEITTFLPCVCHFFMFSSGELPCTPDKGAKTALISSSGCGITRTAAHNELGDLTCLLYKRPRVPQGTLGPSWQIELTHADHCKSAHRLPQIQFLKGCSCGPLGAT